MIGLDRASRLLVILTALFASLPGGSESGTLTNAELHRLLSLFDPPTTPAPPPSTTRPSSSFLPTEVILPRPARRPPQQSIKRNGQQGPQSAPDLLQQLTLLSSLLEAQQKVEAQVQAHEAKNSTPPPKPGPHAPPLPVEDTTAALQSLALLSLLGGGGGLGAPAPSAPVTRQTATDPSAAALTSLLLAQGQGQGQQGLQNFQGFTNTNTPMDAAASNQLSGLLSLLGTLGSLSASAAGGGAQSLFNFGQPAPQPQQPNFLASLLGGGSQDQQQANLLASLLGQQPASNSLFSQPQPQPPSVLASLGSLGSSLFTAAGNTLGGLSGTSGNGKPRVRGMDTRVGVGYRLGQNADAQVMVELGPQLFTEPLPNEVRPGNPAQPLRDIRQPSTHEIQKLLQEELEKQQQLTRRQQVRQLTPEEIEHQRIGQFLHAASSQPNHYYAPRPHPPSPPPRVRQLFPYQNQHQRPHQHPPFYPQRPPASPAPVNQYYRNLPAQTTRQDPRMLVNRPSASVQTFNPEPAPALRPKAAPAPKPKPKAKAEDDSYSMLTQYEKWLLKQGALAAPGRAPGAGLTKRMLPNAASDENERSAPKSPPNKNRFTFRGPTEDGSPQNHNTTSKIVRMTQRRPGTLKPEAFLNRAGSVPRAYQMPPQRFQHVRHFQPPPQPQYNGHPNHWPYPAQSRGYQRPYAPFWPAGPSKSRSDWGHYGSNPIPPLQHPSSNGQVRPPIRRSQPQPQRVSQQRQQPQRVSQQHQQAQRQPQRVSQQQHQRLSQHMTYPTQPRPSPAPIDRNSDSYNPWQNFVLEADDSFLRRNAPSNIHNEKLAASGPPEKHKVVPEEEPESPEPDTPAGPSSMFGVLKEAIRPVAKYFRPTPDPLHPFGQSPQYAHYKGVYRTTTEPTLIATPTPTPVPSLYDQLGRRNPAHDQARAVVHIGESLSYGELAETLQLPVPKSKGKTKKGKPKKKPMADSEAEESKTVDDDDDDDNDLRPSGVEMFIDIESGEVSVRKPIASLTDFGTTTTTTTTTPEPKTEDEIEDAESGQIFARLQEHFKESYEEYQVSSAAHKAANERKEKIKKAQDDSLGMVNRYFDLLTDGDEETSRRRKRGNENDSPKTKTQT